MNDPIMPAVLAFAGASALAVVLFIPFVAISYRRRGHLSAWRIIGWVALLVYALAIITYTFIPLPASGIDYVCRPAQTNWFQFLSDIRQERAQGSRWLHNQALQQFVFNIALFVPLGVLLRSMFQRGIIVATLTGFLVSLSVEVTQLTGIWGIYPCPYRYFDVDDLLANTAGALLGSIAAWMLFLRGRDAGDARQPQPVTPWRRLLGMLCDVLFVGLLGALLAFGIGTAQMMLTGQREIPADEPLMVVAVLVPYAIQLLSVLSGGVTLGERAVLLRSVPGSVPGVIARPLRFVLGIGGYGILSLWEFPFSGLVLVVFVLVHGIAAFVGRPPRGLAVAVSGLGIEDARVSRTPRAQ